MVDEYGSAVGMLTLEDALEVVVGEVKVVYRFEEQPFRRKRSIETIEEDVYLLDARLPLSEVNDVLGVNLPGDRVRTVGGMLIEHLRRIPKEGEYVVDSGYRFTVVEATERAVARLRAEPES